MIAAGADFAASAVTDGGVLPMGTGTDSAITPGEVW